MPIITPTTPDEQSLLAELEKLRSVSPWLFCIEFIDPDVRNDGFDFLVSNTEEIEWDGCTFKPFPFNVGKITKTTTKQLPSIQLTMFNSLKLNQVLERHNGFTGVTLVLYILNTKILQQFNNEADQFTREAYPYKIPFTVTHCTIKNLGITFELGTPNYLQSMLPAKIYTKNYCPFSFEGEFCWLKGIFDDILTADAQLDTPLLSDPKYQECNKTYEFCKQYWRSASQSAKKELHSHPVPNGVPYGGFPMVERGDLQYE